MDAELIHVRIQAECWFRPPRKSRALIGLDQRMSDVISFVEVVFTCVHMHKNV